MLVLIPKDKMFKKLLGIFLLFVSLYSYSQVMTADQVFNENMIGNVWHFKDGHSPANELWIILEPPPQSVIAGFGGVNVVVRYLKSTANCANGHPELDGYWGAGACGAGLRFVMHKVDAIDQANGMTADIGSWISIASLVNFPVGPTWAPGLPLIETINVSINPSGIQQGYLILTPSEPTNLTVHTTQTSYLFWSKLNNLTFNSIASGSPNGPIRWVVFNYAGGNLVIPNVYSGPVFTTNQMENCDGTPPAGGIGCAWELWDYAPGLGIVRIAPFNKGDNVVLPSTYIMIRQPY
jgi:hypothetical protein